MAGIQNTPIPKFSSVLLWLRSKITCALTQSPDK
jgi:hypothetical protein